MDRYHDVLKVCAGKALTIPLVYAPQKTTMDVLILSTWAMHCLVSVGVYVP